MGMLSSCIKKVEAVRFRPFPTNRVVRNIERLIRVDAVTYAVCKNGTIYTTSEMSGNVCYCGTGPDYHAVKALVAFGIITGDEAERHGAQKRESDAALEQYRAVTAEIERLTDAGIKLTKGQKTKLAEMKKNLPVKSLPWFVRDEAAKKLGVKV